MAESEAPEFAQGWVNDPQEVEGVLEEATAPLELGVLSSPNAGVR